MVQTNTLNRKELKMSRLTELQKRLYAKDIRPEWVEGLEPICDECCPSHNGERCEQTGFLEAHHCILAVIAMGKELAVCPPVTNEDAQWRGTCSWCGEQTELFKGEPTDHELDEIGWRRMSLTLELYCPTCADDIGPYGGGTPQRPKRRKP
jgi:hypothetical protein